MHAAQREGYLDAWWPLQDMCSSSRNDFPPLVSGEVHVLRHHEDIFSADLQALSVLGDWPDLHRYLRTCVIPSVMDVRSLGMFIAFLMRSYIALTLRHPDVFSNQDIQAWENAFVAFMDPIKQALTQKSQDQKQLIIRQILSYFHHPDAPLNEDQKVQLSVWMNWFDGCLGDVRLSEVNLWHLDQIYRSYAPSSRSSRIFRSCSDLFDFHPLWSQCAPALVEQFRLQQIIKQQPLQLGQEHPKDISVNRSRL